MSQSWSLVGSLTNKREAFGITKLSNGKILVIGGQFDPSTIITSCEIFTPGLDAWSAAASLPEDLEGMGVMLLNNGKVLVAGGVKNNGSAYSSDCFIYDPIGDSWSTTGSMSHIRAFPAIWKLSNGNVLIAAGVGSTQTAEIYNVGLGTWSDTTTLNHTHQDPSFAKTGDGRYLLAGDTSSAETIEIYDENTTVWTNITIPGGVTITDAEANSNHLITLPSGDLLGIGGGVAGVSKATCYIFHQGSNTLTATGSMATARLGHVLFLQSDGTVVVAGGDNNFSGVYSSCEIYDPNTGLWSPFGSLNDGRSRGPAGFGGFVLNDGRAIIMGGTTTAAANTPQASTEVLSALSTTSPKKWATELVF